VSAGRRSGAPGARRARALAWAALVGVAGVAIVAIFSGAGCRRSAPPPGASSEAPVAARPRLPAARHEPPFTHPLLAGATTAVTHENCSRSALGVVVERAQTFEVKADPAAGQAGSKRAGGPNACPSPAAAETEKVVRGELLPRVDGCVARDGPLDPQWDVVHAAVLSLGVCLDCTRPHDEQVAQCRRARDLLAQVAKTPR
jgi:hypothetical protein